MEQTSILFKGEKRSIWIEKATYKDNAQNRKMGRVGKEFGKPVTTKREGAARGYAHSNPKDADKMLKDNNKLLSQLKTKLSKLTNKTPRDKMKGLMGEIDKIQQENKKMRPEKPQDKAEGEGQKKIEEKK